MSPRVIVGVSGGIAAYKIVEVVRGLREAGCDVQVVPTANALKFVGRATWEAISGQPVAHDVWDNAHAVPHVQAGQHADVVLIAPATADFIARAVHGIASDLLTNVLLTARCPVLIAPAMHTEMWEHPATRANIALLRERGIEVIEPAVGRLTGTDSGAGRLPDPAYLVAECLDHVRGLRHKDLRSTRVVISAGATQEAWDPVRYMSNRSSGRQGIALARTALSRGADVTLVLGAVDSARLREVPSGVKLMRAWTAHEMAAVMAAEATAADVIVMNAAVADFAPVPATHKIKKGADQPHIDLEQTTDILRFLVQHRQPGQTIVGFAAETGSDTDTALEMARRKFADKGCDLLVFNDVSGGQVFNEPTNAVTIVSAGGELAIDAADKAVIADRVWDVVVSERRSER